MSLQLNKIQKTIGLLLVIAGFTTTAMAAGPHMVEHHGTIEGARITVKASSDNTSGVVTITPTDCGACKYLNYTYDHTTLFVSVLGAERTIDELPSLSGNNAMFHYRLDNSHIDYLKILP